MSQATDDAYTDNTCEHADCRKLGGGWGGGKLRKSHCRTERFLLSVYIVNTQVLRIIAAAKDGKG